MATPKPGEIRCPTCHRSTPPAGFCTQCGSVIPSDARVRPRGMDRVELQDRIRARRSGGDPYRRGGVPDDGSTGYERYEPELGDSNARRSGTPAERRQDVFRDAAAVAPVVPPPSTDPRSASIVPPIEPSEPVGAPGPMEPAGPSDSIVPPIGPSWPDVTRETDDWTEPRKTDDAVAAAAAAAVVSPPLPSDVPTSDAQDEVGYVDNFDDEAYDDYQPYAYDWEEPRERRSSGAGAFAILGFLALGVLALMGGAVLAGVFGGDPNAGAVPSVSASPTIEESIAPSVEESVAPSTVESAGPSGSPGASGEPVVFPDGFAAETQPCIPGSADIDGCDSNAGSNSGTVWVWVGFQNGTEEDVLAAIVSGPDSDTVLGEGTIPLERIGCAPTCPGGWTYFPFSNLAPGTYEVRVERNGQLAAETSFTVE